MSPIDQLRVPSPRVGPEEAATNRQRNARDLLSIVPGPGNVIAAEDAVQAFREANRYRAEGEGGKAMGSAALGMLSGVGAVLGLPTGRLAGNAARGAKDAVFSGAGPTIRTPGDIHKTISENNRIGKSGDYRLYGPSSDDTYEIFRSDGRRVGDINVGQMDDGSVLLGPRIAPEYQKQGIASQV